MLFLFLSLPIAYSASGRSSCRQKILRSGLPPIIRAEDVDLNEIPISIKGVRDAVVVSIAHEENFLMLQRGGAIGTGEWGLVGGKLDPGESLAQALYREVGEEVGLQNLSDLEVVHVHYHVFSPTEIFRVFVVRAKFDPSEVPVIKEPDRILDMRWSSLKNLPTPLFGNFHDYGALLVDEKNLP